MGGIAGPALWPKIALIIEGFFAGAVSAGSAIRAYAEEETPRGAARSALESPMTDDGRSCRGARARWGFDRRGRGAPAGCKTPVRDGGGSVDWAALRLFACACLPVRDERKNLRDRSGVLGCLLYTSDAADE